MKNIYPHKSDTELDTIWSSSSQKGPIKTNTREDYMYECKLYIGGTVEQNKYLENQVLGKRHFYDGIMCKTCMNPTAFESAEAVYYFIKTWTGALKPDGWGFVLFWNSSLELTTGCLTLFLLH